MALLALDTGVRIQVIGFQRHTRRDLPNISGFACWFPANASRY
ncbi:hypothetical protein [Pelomonas aquatica]|jgi:hypothetical protein|nr:hypothetical protein [Pelomonas aquatica]